MSLDTAPVLWGCHDGLWLVSLASTAGSNTFTFEQAEKQHIERYMMYYVLPKLMTCLPYTRVHAVEHPH